MTPYPPSVFYQYLIYNVSLDIKKKCVDRQIAYYDFLNGINIMKCPLC